MEKPLLLLLALALMGCEEGYDGQSEAILEKQIRVIESGRSAFGDLRANLKEVSKLPEARALSSYRDSILALGPSIRYYNDSLAHEDSVIFAWLLSMQASELQQMQDTVSGVFAYLEVLPWIDSFTQAGQMEYMRDLAEAAGHAVVLTRSPNMARLTYQASERAKRLALDYGDPQYIHLADSSYKATVRRVLTMPDSVRAAFGPPTDRPARVPWVLATLAAAFIAFSAASGWRWKGST